MRVLMISTDRTLLGELVGDGDVVDRHRHYGQLVDELDIIIFTRAGYQTKELADNVFCYATNSSSRIFYCLDAKRIAGELFAENYYDLIVCQDPFLTGIAGYFIKRKFGSKLLIHFHGDFWDNNYWLKQSMLNYPLLLISQFTVRHADALRVVASGIKRKLIAAGVPAAKIKTIHTPVNLEKFQNHDNQTVLSIKAEFVGKKIIFWLGRMAQEKNLGFLLQSFAQIIKKYPEAVLLLGGSGKELPAVQKQIVRLNLGQNIKLLGRIDYQNVANYFYAADIFVLPSLHESFGKVLLEAAAVARPAVATATTGAQEIIINKKTGLLVALNNQKQFVAKVLSLLANDQLANKLGNAAYEHVTANFNYQETVKQIINYWEEIVTGFKTKQSKI
ncbi:hypothetical protein COW86_03905 [Candidatus Kuenenbacteria bacterium CG22_combo_CG10-13_8_21_14_all_39_9]|uniref:Glycosyl transferase family 1 domain-containing protein n=1 Tax=Candidatus Kuenenbacteria bacterium CG22_combo_CG10-13_8_21_14_all_39_9 TaxID=1974621 RepID=A0A2H0CZV9_9BACT|nr:MAG: hypothetical protein COW86_03905 [Candidatus Kuenenbacteria bacterium CG22_combo_CG10-13_8_21_14_all_39_9]